MVAAPRLALSKINSSDAQVFASVYRGFSSPTVKEILPSTAELNKDLKAEQGLQYEIGSKGYLFNHRLYYDVNLFLTNLNESISSRRDDSGTDYFINAGGTTQKGLETALTYIAYQNNNTFFNQIRTWGNLILFNFKYKDYQSEGNDFSENHFPGSAKTNFTAGVDLKTRPSLNGYLTLNIHQKFL